jgi:carbon-monoxide dehydrogenase medium subunit
VRKTGEYAESMAIALLDRLHGTARVVVGAVDGAPILLRQAAKAALADATAKAELRDVVRADLAGNGFSPGKLELHSNVAVRAISQAMAQ